MKSGHLPPGDAVIQPVDALYSKPMLNAYFGHLEVANTIRKKPFLPGTIGLITRSLVVCCQLLLPGLRGPNQVHVFLINLLLASIHFEPSLRTFPIPILHLLFFTCLVCVLFLTFLPEKVFFFNLLIFCFHLLLLGARRLKACHKRCHMRSPDY